MSPSPSPNELRLPLKMLGNACRPFSSLLPWNPLTHDNTEIQLWNYPLQRSSLHQKVHVLSVTRGDMRGPDCWRHRSRQVSGGWMEGAILRARLFPADARGVHLVASLSSPTAGHQLKSNSISHNTTSVSNTNEKNVLSYLYEQVVIIIIVMWALIMITQQ